MIDICGTVYFSGVVWHTKKVLFWKQIFFVTNILGHQNLSWYTVICPLSVGNLFKLCTLSVDLLHVLQQSQYSIYASDLPPVIPTQRPTGWHCPVSQTHWLLQGPCRHFWPCLRAQRMDVQTVCGFNTLISDIKSCTILALKCYVLIMYLRLM